ncbi:MAG: hypothetical protein HC913_16170 [Microscillaceae bacterium]|nr:hypothetical protein [Microscillaceae bacterium]
MEASLTDVLLYLSIPLSGGLIGWGTNVLAIKMTFYPLEFVGIRPIGWQGIIPSKAKKMAEKSVDMLTAKLLKIEERFALIEPERVAEDMLPNLSQLSHQIIDEVMEGQYAFIWRNTPKPLKNQIYASFTRELPAVIVQMMEDVKTNIHDLLDLRTLGVNALTQNKALLNQMFIDCGKEEFKFIERSGLYFGIPFGLVQMCIAIFYNPWWLLPLFGLLVGYATNWLALRMIFEPEVPKIYFGGRLVLQGLFIKRQKEVAIAYAHIVSNRILTTESMFEFMMRGPGGDKLADIVKRIIEQAIDTGLENAPTLVNVAIGPKQTEIIKNIAVYRFNQELPLSIRDTFVYAQEALDMENMLREKMQGLTPPEFVGFLRPVFQEDEWILILVGAVLGLLAGFLQYLLLFQ